MDLDKRTVLLAAIDTGNLTRAAERLGYTQSGLSYIIKSLEAEVGFPLLLRSRTGVQPTAECRRILPLLRDLEQRNRRLEQEMADIRGVAVGTVSIASFPCISRFWLPDILRDFKEKYPAITVALREGGQEDVDSWLRDGVVEMAFCSWQPDRPYDWVGFMEDDLLVVVPESHPLAGLNALPLQDIGDEPFILENGIYDHDIQRALQEAAFSPNVCFTSMDELAILAMVRVKLGVSILPGLYLREPYPGVAAIQLNPRVRRRLGVAVPEREELSPAARRFLMSAQDTFGRQQGNPPQNTDV